MEHGFSLLGTWVNNGVLSDGPHIILKIHERDLVNQPHPT